MRYMLHSVPLLIIILVFSLKLSYPVEKIIPWNYVLWIIGFSGICYVLIRYRNENIIREVPIWSAGLTIMFSDAISAAFSDDMLLLLKIIAAYAIWWIIFVQFWISRHAMCNYLNCPLNPLVSMEKKRPR